MTLPSPNLSFKHKSSYTAFISVLEIWPQFIYHVLDINDYINVLFF